MHLEIITPDREVFSGDVETAFFPGSNGSFQVLDNHAPMISALGYGSLTYKTREETKNLSVEGGVVEVLDNRVTVLAEHVQ